MRVVGRDEIKTDVRLVTATNRNLPLFVRQGKFREDLFMRLNVVQMRVPSLREHKEEIASMCNERLARRRGYRAMRRVDSRAGPMESIPSFAPESSTRRSTYAFALGGRSSMRVTFEVSHIQPSISS